jgi:plasmid replication initiation protein
MFFHPVSVILPYIYIFLCRNSYIKTGEHHLMRLLMTVFNHAQLITEGSYIKISYCQVVPPYSMVLTKNFISLSKKELMLDLMLTSRRPVIRLRQFRLRLLKIWFKDMQYGLEAVSLDQSQISVHMWLKASKCMKNMVHRFADIIQFLETECDF